MSVEGGPYSCSVHKYKTESVKAWNSHMLKEKHYDATDTICIECGTRFTAIIPFQPVLADGSKGISLKCSNCEKKEKSK